MQGVDRIRIDVGPCAVSCRCRAVQQPRNKQGYPSHRDSMGRRNPAVNVRVHRRGNAADIAEPTAIIQASRAEICRLSANLAATLFAGREAAA
jgi:hypothetical protein